jgi:hypothetical protein
MKIKLGLIILIICAFVLGTCSTWEGDEGVVNIRIVGENGSSGRSRTIVDPYPKDSGDDSGAYGLALDEDEHGYMNVLQLKDFTYDIYFVKNVYPSIGYEVTYKKHKEGINDNTGEPWKYCVISRQPKDNNSIPKDNIGGGRENVKYGDKVACSLVPGTWILIINGYVTKEDGIRAQGVVEKVEIKPGKNEDIEIEMLYTRAFVGDTGPIYETDLILTYIAPIIGEQGIVLTKGANF